MTPPRYCPSRSLPAYAYVPGRAPHPVTDPRGHSYGCREPDPPFQPAERWRENEAFLHGVDCFNAGFCWEAHEAWEGVWKASRGRDDAQAALVQGLILAAAARVKLAQGEAAGAVALGVRAATRLTEARARAGSVFMGIDVPAFTRQVRAHLVDRPSSPVAPEITLTD